MESTTSSRPLPRTLALLIVLGVLAAVLFSIVPASIFNWLGEKLNVFATIFLGIFIEAIPYLLLGTLASGLIEVFIDRTQMSRFIPSGSFTSALAGAVLGLAFPVCECGVIPLTRRLFHKGLPLPAGIAFLLAAPVFNPIVILSTAAAFGWGKMLAWRVGLTLLIAVIVGLVFSVGKNDATSILLPASVLHLEVQEDAPASLLEKIRRALVIGADEFFEMGRYLVVGAILAAALQTFLPQGALLAIGGGPLLSVLVMISLAFILSICSTVDAFVALGFVGTFSFGAVLSFLVFGPMVDIKTIIMYRQVFRTRTVVYLVVFPFLMSLLAGLTFNYFFPG
ncbi:MAG TPA: permease [Anaerolineales bacterium]|nr:permease [Anaerolineales bacterium]